MNVVLSAHLPRISIVMPSLNQAAYLEEAIQSVLGQDYPDTELVVMDGGSTDGTVEILSRFGNRISHWESKADGGQSPALNLGLAHLTGEIVGWLNSDDTYAPGTFREVARVFEQQGTGIAMSSHFGMIDASGKVLADKRNEFTNHSTLIRFWATNGMTINQPCVFFRRRLVREMSPVFDTSLHYAMDYDLWLRLTMDNEIQVVDGLWANYRFHDTSKSGTGFGKFFPEWYAVSKRYWGSRTSPSWWANWLHHFYFHYPRRVIRGIARRARGMINA